MFCLYPLSMCFKSNNKCNTSMNLRLSLTVVKRSVTISVLIINIQPSLFIPYLDLSDCVKTVPCRWLQWIMIRSSRVVMRGSRKHFQGGGGVSDGYLSLLRRGGGGVLKFSKITVFFIYMRKNFNRKNTSPTKSKGNPKTVRLILFFYVYCM